MDEESEKQLAEQLHELQRWHNVMLDREGRVIELLGQAGQPPRYASAVRKDE